MFEQPWIVFLPDPTLGSAHSAVSTVGSPLCSLVPHPRLSVPAWGPETILCACLGAKLVSHHTALSVMNHFSSEEDY